jgi:hypothetical protein
VRGTRVYGVMSYVVRQRTREIGTRIALGATRRDILWLVMREGALIAIGGTITGLLIGLAVAWSLASILYGVSSSHPATLSVAAGVLVATIMAACYLPAQRAASVDSGTDIGGGLTRESAATGTPAGRKSLRVAHHPHILASHLFTICRGELHRSPLTTFPKTAACRRGGGSCVLHGR